jgi:tetrahydromethanopterin S-methyltransferase subunit G
MVKVKTYKFWIPAEFSVGTSKHRLFVAKADYDRVIKRLKEIEDYVRNHLHQ